MSEAGPPDVTGGRGADVPNSPKVSLDGFPNIQRMESLLSQDHTALAGW